MRKRILLGLLICSTLGWSQRYVSEIFSSVSVTADVTYATNIDFLTSNFSDATQVAMDVTAIKTALATGQPIPTHFFDPTSSLSDVKVTNVQMDVYEPMGDTVTNRPVVILLHTGNFLPPRINGGILGTRKDSTMMVLAEKLARRGFVAIAASYRLGWNPLAPTQIDRRAQLLNAVYRAIHDTKECVRVLRADASGANTYGIDPNKVSLYGSGTGGYIALAYATLDKWSEVQLQKFINPVTQSSVVDSNQVGNIEGFGGLLNLYANNGQSSDVQLVINTGGALADTSWLEPGDAPMIAFQAVRDPFAPYDNGTVVVPTTQEDVVEVQGANIFIARANRLGNNASLNSAAQSDPISQVARSRYGKTIPYIFPAPFDQITINSNLENHFPVIKPLPPNPADIFNNQGSPWQWWDPNGPIASDTLLVGPPVVTYHMAGLASNPGMSPQQGRAYLDTILNYSTPRMVASLNLPIGLEERSLHGKVSLYPNPVGDVLRIDISDRKVHLQTIEIRDITGRVVRLEKLDEAQRSVDVSTLKRGVYLVKIIADDGVLTERIVKS